MEVNFNDSNRYFINRLAKNVWELNQGKIAKYLGNYDDFKGKSEERLSQDSKSVSGISRMREGRTFATGRQQQGENGVKSSDLRRTNERRREQLELEIAVLEAELSRADEELNSLDRIGDTLQLESRWHEREERQLQLDKLMELWMELSS